MLKSAIKVILSLWAVVILVSCLPSCLNLLSQSNWIEPLLGVLVTSLNFVGLVWFSRIIGTELGKLVISYLNRKKK